MGRGEEILDCPDHISGLYCPHDGDQVMGRTRRGRPRRVIGDGQLHHHHHHHHTDRTLLRKCT